VAAERLYGVDDATIDLFARHFYLGEEPQKAYPFLLRAAARAERLFANEQALTQLRRALELTDLVAAAEEDRLDLVLRCAKLEDTIGNYEEASSLYREAAATGSLTAAIGEAQALRSLGRFDEAGACIARARLAHPDPSPADEAELAFAEVLLGRLRGELRPAVEALERALALVSGQGSALEGELLLELGYTYGLTGDYRRGLSHAERARLLFERAGDLPRLARTLRTLGGMQSDVANEERDREGLQQARATLEQAQALARRVGNAEEQAASLINLAVILDQLEEYEVALEASREALAAFESVGLKGGIACAWCNIADHLTSLARWEEALDAASHGLAVAQELDMPIWITGALLSTSRSELALGNTQAAAAAAEEALRLALAHGLPDRAKWSSHHAIAAHEALGNHERVEDLRRQSDELGHALPAD
jgi:tetratricopeptide (TPR) repeat protein